MRSVPEPITPIEALASVRAIYPEPQNAPYVSAGMNVLRPC